MFTTTLQKIVYTVCTGVFRECFFERSGRFRVFIDDFCRKICQNLSKFVKICQKFCQNLSKFVKICQNFSTCLQKFEKMCKFCQNFWQFLTIFAKFFFKKNKKIKIFFKKLFFFGTTYRKICSVHLEIFCRHTYIYILKNCQKKS